MARKQNLTSAEAMVMDTATPWQHRVEVLKRLCGDPSKASQEAVKSLLESAANANGEAIYAKKIKEAAAMIEQLKAGPLRPATFVQLAEASSNGNGSGVGNKDLNNELSLGLRDRAHVLTEEGTGVYPAVLTKEFGHQLRCGEQVLIDGQGKMVLFTTNRCMEIGEEGRLERRIDRSRVEVSLRDYEKFVYRAAETLVEALDQGLCRPGDMLLVCPRRWMAFDMIPRNDELSHYKYLCKQSVPDVVVERDIGAAPGFIRELEAHVRMEMTQPELGKKYRLLRCRMKMLVGVSGSGKTLSILGLWRRIYEVMSEVTGVPLEDLPPRVLRLRPSDVLSKWYSESEKGLDKFFDEAEQLASEKFVLPNGDEIILPLIVICEEVDGLARSRGTDAVHDRVQTTLLQRLDATSQKLRDRLILFLFTSNVPELIDPAFLRRAGATIVRYDRLSRRGCTEVLDKHLRDLPLRVNGKTAVNDAVGRQVKSEILPWLYSVNGQDKGLVEIHYVGAAEPQVKYRRDFLTGALVARAVQEAAEIARLGEWKGESSGVTPSQLIKALSAQIQSLVDQLHPHNVHQYVSIPDGVRVASVRRIPQAELLPIELTRPVSESV